MAKTCHSVHRTAQRLHVWTWFLCLPFLGSCSGNVTGPSLHDCDAGDAGIDAGPDIVVPPPKPRPDGGGKGPAEAEPEPTPEPDDDQPIIVPPGDVTVITTNIVNVEAPDITGGDNENCGNGSLDPGEECDDGNLRGGDGCTATCRMEGTSEAVCGDFIVSPGEECEPPGNEVCDTSCRIKLPVECGNSQLDPGESCDDGNLTSGDGCSVACRIEAQPPVGGAGNVEPEPDVSNGGTGAGGSGNLGGQSGEGGMGGVGGAPPEDGFCNPAIDIDQDGIPDCDENWLLNSQFYETRDFWSEHTVENRTITLDRSTQSADGDANSGSLSVRLNLTVSDADIRLVSGAVQCVNAGSNLQFQLGAQYFIASTEPVTTRASMHVLFYGGPDCGGTQLSVWGSASGDVRDAWTTLMNDFVTPEATQSFLVRLNVSRHATDPVAAIMYDNVLLADPLGLPPSNPGSTCGDGQITGNEQCEPPSTATCNSSCRSIATSTACNDCSSTSCSAEFSACSGATGNAEAGPLTGTPRSTLCTTLASCVWRTGCAPDGNLSTCYCGDVDVLQCVGREAGPTPNGLCKAEIEAAAETTDPFEVANRLESDDDATFASVLAATLVPCQHAQCSTDCAVAGECGNGVTETGETCDDGNTSPGDGCDAQCRREAVCGDGTTEGSEGCDDGNTSPGDGCSAQCQIETVCGDGTKEGAEECDDGNTSPGDGCDASCAIEPICGNGTKEGSEGCDDGNTSPGDGCDASCQLEGGNMCASCSLTACADYAGQCNVASCQSLLTCVRTTECADVASLECLCGAGVDPLTCLLSGPQGQCLEEIETAAETTDPQALIERSLNVEYASGDAFQLIECERLNCAADCGLTPDGG